MLNWTAEDTAQPTTEPTTEPTTNEATGLGAIDREGGRVRVDE